MICVSIPQPIVWATLVEDLLLSLYHRYDFVASLSSFSMHVKTRLRDFTSASSQPSKSNLHSFFTTSPLRLVSFILISSSIRLRFTFILSYCHIIFISLTSSLASFPLIPSISEPVRTMQTAHTQSRGSKRQRHQVLNQDDRGHDKI